MDNLDSSVFGSPVAVHTSDESGTRAIILYREAKARGLSRYYNGVPCKRGHLAERRTSDRRCLGCTAASRKTPSMGRVGRSPQPSDWPPERDTKMVRLRDLGVSYSAIGMALGVTKNAAIGRARRIGLMLPKGPQPMTTIRRLDALNIFPEAGECVFPIGHPKEAGFHFCGQHVDEVGAPYCELHHHKVYKADKAESEGGFVPRMAAE